MGHFKSTFSLLLALMHVGSAYGPLCATHTHKGHLESKIALQITHICVILTCIWGICRVKLLSKSPMCGTHMHMGHLQSKSATHMHMGHLES